MTERLAIIGTGMAGARLAESLIAEGYRGQITMLGEERDKPYNRIQLSTVLAGDKPIDGLPLLSDDWYRAHDITLHGGDPVVHLDGHNAGPVGDLNGAGSHRGPAGADQESRGQ